MNEKLNWRDEIKQHNFDNQKWVVLNDLGPLLGYKEVVTRWSASIKLWLDARGFNSVKIAVPIKASGVLKTMKAWCVNSDFVDDIIEQRSSFIKGFSESDELQDQNGCTFYVIQLYPDHFPQIVKCGYTTRTANERKGEFMSFTSKILREYDIGSSKHESTLLQMIFKDYEMLSSELAIVPDLTNFLERADKILELL